MKKFIVLAAIAVFAMAISPVMAGVWWVEGAPDSTYQQWDFTPDNVVSSGPSAFSAAPEVLDNDYHSTGVSAVISSVYGGILNYDGQTGFTGDPAIHVFLQIPNNETIAGYKEIWINIGDGLNVVPISATGHDGDVTEFTSEFLPGDGIWDLGVMIWPNPLYEKIEFVVEPLPGTAAYLDSIEVWTICVPEPTTLALLGLGGLLMRKRK